MAKYLDPKADVTFKKDLKVVTSQTEYPIKSLQGRGVRFDVFARDSKGREYDIEIQRSNETPR